MNGLKDVVFSDIDTTMITKFDTLEIIFHGMKIIYRYIFSEQNCSRLLFNVITKIGTSEVYHFEIKLDLILI